MNERPGNKNLKPVYRGQPSPSRGKPRKKSLLGVLVHIKKNWKTHPIDKLVKLANALEASDPEMAARIWIRLLDAIENEEREKKKNVHVPVAPKTQEKESALEALEKLENDGQQGSSHTGSLADGAAQIQIEASPEADIREHKGE